jgi:peroxiredoxin
MFVYPATGVPGRDPQLDPAPGWDDVPGAPGCTVHSLGYRDLIAGFQSLGFTVVGVSAQPSDEQREFVARNNIPFVVLSDPQFALAAALGLPTFTVGARRFYRRLSAVVVDGTIEHVSYPVFPPHTNAAEVLKWLRSMTADGDRL